MLRADEPMDAEHQAQDQPCSATCAPDCVIENLTLPSLYECPLMLESQTVWTTVVCRQLQLETPPSDLTEWKEHAAAASPPAARTCTIALVGKYVKLHDAYLSVVESAVPRRL